MAIEHLTDPTTTNAISRTDGDLKNLQPGQSVDSVAQRDIHDARMGMSPEQYNAFLSGVEVAVGPGSQQDVIRHYGKLELVGDNQSQQSTLSAAYAGDKTALDKLGFHGADAQGNLKDVFGETASNGTDSPVGTPSENGTVVNYPDGSNRGFHYQSGADGQPVMGPDGKPVIDGVNETDKNGISRKLVLQDGKWISGATSQPWAVANNPLDGGSRTVVDNFNADPAVSVSDKGSLMNQLTPSEDSDDPSLRSAPRPNNLLPVDGPNPGTQVNLYPNGTTETLTNGQPTRYETQNGTYIEKHDDGKWWVHEPGKPVIGPGKMLGLDKGPFENLASAGVPTIDSEGNVKYSGTGMVAIDTYTLGADNSTAF